MESTALLIAASLNAGTILALASLGLLINEKAGIVNLGAEPFTMSGSTHVVIDRSEYDLVPPGFTVPSVLAAVPTTYTEH